MIGELTVEKDGVALVPNCLSDNLLNELNVAVSRSQPNTRNILAIDQISRLACSDTVRRWITPILGEGCFAVRGILFNKNPMSNRKVAWHQDCVIAVRPKSGRRAWVGPVVGEGGDSPRAAASSRAGEDGNNSDQFGQLRTGRWPAAGFAGITYRWAVVRFSDQCHA